MSHPSPSPTALLLIDVQESFRARPYWSDAETPAFFERTNALIAGCAAAGIPVVQVFHTDGPNSADNAFAHASDEGWEVDYVTEATLTFAMTTPAGATLSPADLRERTETVLAGRFATICTVDEALARARSA